MNSDRTGKIPVPSESLLARIRVAARQEQFLEVVSPDEARARFELDPEHIVEAAVGHAGEE